MNTEYKHKKQIYIVGKGTGEQESASAEGRIRTDRPMLTHYQVDDIVCMKKPHPCGSKEWKILRTGTDIKMQCQGCGHEVMIPRQKFEKQVKNKK